MKVFPIFSLISSKNMGFCVIYYILVIKMWKTLDKIQVINTLNSMLIHSLWNVWKSAFNRIIIKWKFIHPQFPQLVSKHSQVFLVLNIINLWKSVEKYLKHYKITIFAIFTLWKTFFDRFLLWKTRIVLLKCIYNSAGCICL